MLRAATAASGGTGAPDWTYCSIWPWTVRTSAWTWTSVAGCSASSSTRARMNGSVSTKSSRRSRRLALDDGAHRAVLELDDLGDLGQRADVVQLGRVGDVFAVGLALGDQRDRAAFGDGLVEGRRLLSRPTWSGTIISGKMTVSRSATSGSSRDGDRCARSSGR